MDFLKLNGIAIPVENDSASFSFEELGSRQRTMDGSLRTTRTALKRVWQFRTPILDPETALMIAGLVAGNGHHFGYDVDAFDLKGFGPLDPATSNVYSLRKGATDLVPQPSEFGMKYGGAVAVEAATTNIFEANVRRGTDPLANTTGFTAVDAPSIFQSTDIPALGMGWVALQGTRALDFATAVAVNGVRGGIKTNGIVVAGPTTYTASVYVQASGAVRCQLKDVSNAINGTIQTITPPLQGSQFWQRISSTVTTGSPAASLEFEVLEETPDSGVSVWCDQFQLESQPGQTSWADDVRAVGLLRCDVQSFLSAGRVVSEDIRTAVDLTVMFWANRGIDGFSAGERGMFAITNALGSGLNLLISQVLAMTVSQNNPPVFYSVYFQGSDVATPATVLSGSTAWGNNTWKHFAVVVRRNAVFGTDLNKLKVYVDGALTVQSLVTGPSEALPDFSKTKALYVGGTLVANFRHFSGGMIDDFVVVPYAMTAAGISAVFNAGRAFSDLPRLEADGAGIVTGPPRAIVLGELPSGEFVQAHFSATITQNARTVDITLTEV